MPGSNRLQPRVYTDHVSAQVQPKLALVRPENTIGVMTASIDKDLSEPTWPTTWTITFQRLIGAMQVLNNASFRHQRQITGAHDAVLAFATEIDGIQINGIDLIRSNGTGQIVDFKVMVRPLKAVSLLHQQVGAVLDTLKQAQQLPP